VASDKVEGIDVDMAMSLAQSLGVKLDIVKTTWSTLKSDLEANGLDMAMGEITITRPPESGLVLQPVFSRVRRRSRIAETKRNTKRLQPSIGPACN
jgi:membrane-bound lytic murein transglycosylase MltF